MELFFLPLLGNQSISFLPVPNLFSQEICRRPSGVDDLERCVQPGARNGHRP
ncbi:hypothetical protein Brsp06_01662 [Brucella sp. NBRC 13694]|jgi:hypothetical protein|nr:hypothetical protein DR92_2991 [Brucella anthropi]MBA8859035.1 hypothetical protein [Brucella anthropi]NIH74182.1 hypothetical protein [Ochrobactrum sp. P20RRXII]SUB43916.1 Uncharacterised protein [Brucella anthropi]